MSDSRTTDSITNPEDLALTVRQVALSPSYSPATLTHLRQPVPADLPADLAADDGAGAGAGGVFTFQDAFEDLLAVAQGRPLPDIRSRYHHSRMLRQMYPRGEPTWLWLRRLQSQGLLAAGAGRRRSHILRASQAGWDELQRGLEDGAEEFWRGVRDDPRHREAVAEAGRVFRELRDQLDGDSSASDEKNKKGKSSEPEHFDDLYSAIRSAYADGQGAWDAFKRSMNEDLPRRLDEFERRVEEKFNDATPPPPSSSEITPRKNEKETTSEWVDAFGYKHTTVKRKTFDDDGKEIGSSTSITIRPAEKTNDDADAVDNSDGSSTDKKNRGWFW
ncbi:hypothetical protein ISF_06293 [Cordyceps fumosorosea ARSEF 2679]|uniref:Uncharacterized protein n=1 Tax=Cordyceps fumosorosea (strain ARSEF 2679) TaxID=1081104 RepID=A0A167S885_CORFA|nr:hypothetical protein ISF_06293 [Cordyceps fumosorosea ARSEF 2679]OAA59358.1 hypothetical protein ISF_06293 [Cordyceps fumosorosea ARSEF 2679]